MNLIDIKRWSTKEQTAPTLQDDYSDYFWSAGGSEALAQICGDLGSTKGQVINVYLPSYFCGQSLRHLRALPINLFFYSIDSELLPIYSNIRTSHRVNPVNVLVHVHYFGSIKAQEESRDLANELDAVLIEDCAHIISPYALDNWRGDHLIFSPHKHFPLPKIALVISKNTRTNMTFKNYGRFPMAWFVKELIKKFINKRRTVKWKKKWTSQYEFLNSYDVNFFTRRAALSYLLDFKIPAEQRLLNARLLVAQLSGIGGWKPLQQIDQICAPYLLGMICDSAEIAERRFNIINRSSQVVMQWPDLPYEIKNTSFADQNSMLVERTLFFFIHQKVNIKEMSKRLDNLIVLPGF
jgi:hypothetical protein